MSPPGAQPTAPALDPERVEPPGAGPGMPDRPEAVPDIAPEPDACLPIGSLGGSDTIEVHTQSELDALRGCTKIAGDLIIYPFADADLTPLSQLTAVGGTLLLGERGSPDGVPQPGFRSLAGLESLREVGSLILRGVLAPTLESLQGLSRLTPSAGLAPGERSLIIEAAPALTDLRGLERLRDVQTFVARNNPRLTSVAELQLPSRLLQFEIVDSPVTNIASLGSVLSVEYSVRFINTALTSAAGFERLEQAGQLEFSRNAALLDLNGLATLATTNALAIRENPSLASLPALGGLTVLGDLLVEHNSALVDAPSWPQLRSVRNVAVRENAALAQLSSLSSLEEAFEVVIDDNPALVVLELGRLQRATYLRITHNPLLDSTLLPRPSDANVVIWANRGEPVGLDPCPWTSNGFCEAPPFDDLCAPDTDAECSF